MKRAFVLVNSDLASEAELQSELNKVPGVAAVYQVYGLYDMIVELEAESDQELKDLIFSKIRPLNLVKSTITLVVSS